MDPSVCITVAKMESNFDASVIGPKHELGLFQLNPLSFPKYSKKYLLNPKNNIRLGVNYLKEVKDNCIHRTELNWLVCYNYGYENAKHVKYPWLFPYVVRATKIRKQLVEEFESDL
jgi:hypothetical protein